MRHLILLGLCISSNLWAWAAHYAVTAAALDRIELSHFLDTAVKVERLEDFLKAEKRDVSKTIEGFYVWLQTSGSTRFKRVPFDEVHPTVENFMRAARLYPKSEIRYLHRVLPGEVVKGPVIAFHVVSPWEKIEKNFAITFREMKELETTHRAILSTYSDEPDWFLDRDLWSRPEYGYGERPYGKANDPANGAAFHMQFAHENFVIRKLVPGISEGMARDRMELFVRLSQRAYATNHPYWGSRFASWAFHYVQDMSQPYHAKAVPSETIGYFVNFALSGNKPKVVSDTTQLVSNRHLLYEDFVRGLLEKHYVARDRLSQKVYAALSAGDMVFSDIPFSGTAEMIFNKISLISAESAYALDASIQEAYGKKMTTDPNYDVEKDATYDNQAIYRDAAKVESLMKQAILNLPIAAQGTRTILSLCRGQN